MIRTIIQAVGPIAVLMTPAQWTCAFLGSIAALVVYNMVCKANGH